MRSCYDEGKRCAETLFFDYHRQHDLDVKVARIFNTYGPRMHPQDGRVVSNFIVQALSGDPITIYGDGSQTRSFCYVDDLIDGLVRLMESPRGFTGPVNLGNPVEFTMLQLAETVIALTGSSSPIVHERTARRRPPPAPARHLARQRAPRLAAKDRSRVPVSSRRSTISGESSTKPARLDATAGRQGVVGCRADR